MEGRKSARGSGKFKRWVGVLVLAGILCASLILNLTQFIGSKKIKIADLKSAEKLMGLRFSSSERDLILPRITRSVSGYQRMREIELDNSIYPSLMFFPFNPVEADEFERKYNTFLDDIALDAPLIESDEDLAFAPLPVLAHLIRTKKITSTRLTRLYLVRLKKYDPLLKCVITLTEDLALEQAKRADEEIAAGKYRGPLHGIPWGAKDLLATRGIKTTWGAMPYRDQMLDVDATVVKRLADAGAVLVAKLTLGALAMGDVWFGGRTINPWNRKRGSSGSSAGPAAATAAGLVGFSIGTETLGSIVSPSTRCRVTGLRPTFGRVSRHGAMALSWSMDKIGPICRSVLGCAMVFDAIYGPDGLDPTLVGRSFEWDRDLDVRAIRIGYVKSLFDRDKYRGKENDRVVLKALREYGVELVPISLPKLPVSSISFILSAEAAAAFDDLTRSGRDDLLVRQNRGAWPDSFRRSRFIPAVEYIQANRIRTLLVKEMNRLFDDIDVYVVPTSGGSNLLITNLTGHPSVVIPTGSDGKGNSTSISFVGGLYDEARTLHVARIFQLVSDVHRQRPPLDQSVD